MDFVGNDASEIASLIATSIRITRKIDKGNISKNQIFSKIHRLPAPLVLVIIKQRYHFEPTDAIRRVD